jgi:hypothetical protein
MITKLRLAALKALLKSKTTAFNVPLQMSSTQSIKHADHALLTTYTTTLPSNVTAEFHAPFQDNSTQTTFANAQLIKRETRESGTNQVMYAIAHQTSHCGTVNTVSLAQQEPNSIIRKINATTAQMDSKEIIAAMLVFQDFDDQIHTFIVISFAFAFSFQQFSNWSQKIFKSLFQNNCKILAKM